MKLHDPNTKPIDPRLRYKLEGGFDVDSLDFDMEAYPELFDSNGWPRFGSYDPYSLTHPITGAAWHVAPREPELDEDDAEYCYWYELAATFNSVSIVISKKIFELSRKTKLEDSGSLDRLYNPRDRKAIRGNTAYLRTHIHARLEHLIQHRSVSPELAVLWGEFCRVANMLSIAVDVRNERHKQAMGAQRHRLDAQLKFYLHWRRYYRETRGWSVNKANGEFTKLVSDIVNGRVCCPSGFNKRWFQETQLHIMDGESKRVTGYERGLANILRRALKHDRAEALLGSAPDEEPQIPPINFASYKKAL